MTMLHKTILLLVLTLAVVGVQFPGILPVLAVNETPGNGNEGAEACSSCHGENGISPMEGVPHLAGQHAAYLEAALTAYASGARADESMQAATAGLSAEEISRLAFYFSQLPSFSKQAPNPARVYSEPDPFLPVRDIIEGCAGCHGADGNSEIEGMPGIAGQTRGYLATALKAYQTGSRSDDTMQYFAGSMSDDEIETVALYYSRLEAKAAASTAPGDRFAGQAPEVQCAVCHGEDGNTLGPDLPRLAGQDALYLDAAMGAYIDGLRSHDPMREAVMPLNTKQRQDIAAYFASVEPISAPPGNPLTAPGWAERCNRCHGPGGMSTDVRFPKLAGQSESYLVKALKLYHGNDRPSTVMSAMSFVLSEPQIMDLAAYYARIGAGDKNNGVQP